MSVFAASCTAGSLTGCGDETESSAKGAGLETPEIGDVEEALEMRVNVNVTDDTSIRVSAPNKNFGANSMLDVNRGLLKLTPAQLAAAVAPSDVLISARLELTLVDNDARRRQLPRQLGAYRMLKPWTELGATWQCAVDANTANSRPDCTGATAWQMLGTGAFASTPTSTAIVPAARTGVISLDVTADVRAFASGAAANHGWLLKTPVGAILEIAELTSAESATPPRLVLQVRRCSLAECDDQNPCTADACDSAATCIHVPVEGLACDDGNVCTQGDRCVAGACAVGAPRPAGASCGQGQVCDGSATQCVPARVVVNEVESNGGSPGDWVELYNAGTTPVDLSGWRFKDNDDNRAFYGLPAGTTIAPGGYFVLEEAAFSFGLGGADSARLYYPTGDVPADAHAWTAHAATSYGRCPNGGGGFTTNTSVSKGAANDCSVPPVDAGADGGGFDGGVPNVVLNEVESNGGSPGDWVELYNAGTTPADVSGFRFIDNDGTHAFYVIPAGTSIPAGGFLVLDETTHFSFGVGGADTANLYGPTGTTPVDSYAWTSHAPVSYGRCPDGTGAFVPNAISTKGGPNNCAPVQDGGAGDAEAGSDAGLAFAAWPGSSGTASVDLPATFTGNLSGLTYQPAAGAAPPVLWAVQNNPSLLYRLEWSGSQWLPVTSDGWSLGKTLVYPSGLGVPDSEGVSRAQWDSPAIYVATERDNGVGVSRLSILRFDTSAPGTTLTATHEWNVTADLPVVGPNLGLEAISWVPDAYLVASGFVDASTGARYDPSRYGSHAEGLFFVGVEATGVIHAYALDHAGGGFQRVASIASGQAGTMGLEFDRDRNTLWAYCDDTCGNRATLLAVDGTAGSSTLGQFVIRAAFERPSSLPNINNEGIAIAPESECSGGVKSFYWSDDSDTGGQSLRQGSIPCASLF